MVLVMGNHPRRPFQVLSRPGRIVAQSAHDAVGFQVAFAYKEQSQLVAEVVPFWAVGIVAGADGIDVQPLHLPDLLDHVGPADRAAAFPAEIVAVDPADEQALAVEEHHAVHNFDLFETEPAAFPVAFRAVRADQRDNGTVEGRRFRRPEPHFGKL